MVIFPDETNLLKYKYTHSKQCKFLLTVRKIIVKLIAITVTWKRTRDLGRVTYQYKSVLSILMKIISMV